MSKEQEHIEPTTLLLRRLTGEASQEELMILEKWIQADSKNAQLAQEYEQIWNQTESARGLSNEELDHEWERFDHATRSKPNFILKIAASLTLLAVATIALYMFLSAPASTVVIAQNEILEKHLTDSSTITLNARAEVSFNENYGDDNREIYLKSGEVFFEVEKDPDKPFIVHTKQADVTVLGTSFNIRTGPDGNYTDVVVSTGLVELKTRKNKLVLKPGERGLVKPEESDIKKGSNKDVNFNAWKTKTFVFSDTPLNKVVKTLSNAYQISIRIDNDTLALCPLTVSFSEADLPAILEVLQGALEVSVEQEATGYVISGEGCN